MNKYIIAALLVLLLPTVGYAKCCDCCQDKSYITYGTMTMRGYAYEVKPKRLTVTEQLIRTEAFHKIHHGLSKWHCTRCGKSLKYNPVGYYCTSCKTEFDIKEE